MFETPKFKFENVVSLLIAGLIIRGIKNDHLGLDRDMQIFLIQVCVSDMEPLYKYHRQY